MNKAKILKTKPIGIKLYSTLYGECVFSGLGPNSIVISTSDSKYSTDLTQDGKFTDEGEVVLFPNKEMRDWSKFAWKKGDVLVSNDKHKEVIFAGFADDTYTRFKAKHILVDEGYEGIEYSGDGVLQTQNYSLEAKDAAQCYINTIEERLGGKLNLETLEIEDIKPKWAPKPFDRVITRTPDTAWRANIFSHIDGDGVKNCIDDKYIMCLPYNDETAKLIGTTNNLEG